MVYVHTYVEPKPHGIILFVVNGLDQALLQKARQQSEARGAMLHIDQLNKIASLEVKGFGQLVPDEAAASTALASGRRVQNGYFGRNASDQRLDTLIYAAQRAGRATGLVTDDGPDHAHASLVLRTRSGPGSRCIGQRCRIGGQRPD